MYHVQAWHAAQKEALPHCRHDPRDTTVEHVPALCRPWTPRRNLKFNCPMTELDILHLKPASSLAFPVSTLPGAQAKILVSFLTTLLLTPNSSTIPKCFLDTYLKSDHSHHLLPPTGLIWATVNAPLQAFCFHLCPPTPARVNLLEQLVREHHPLVQNLPVLSTSLREKPNALHPLWNACDIPYHCPSTSA